MKEILKDAVDMAKVTMDMVGCEYRECFPYMDNRVIKGDDERTYSVKIKVDILSE